MREKVKSYANTSVVYKQARKRNIRYQSVIGILILMTLILMVMMLMLGNTRYSFETVFRVLQGENVAGATFAIRTIRLPRMLSALLCGIAFGMAGNTFQTMLKNPLASPDIIGVTSGSSVAAVFCILILKMSGTMVSVISVFAGLLVACLIYFLSQGGSFSGGKLILIGIGIQAMLSAFISYLILKASEYDVAGAMRWLSGSLNGMQMNKIPAIFGCVLIAGILLSGMSKQLQILELGDMSATMLGLKTNRTRICLVIAAVCLIAFATAISGPISFVAFLAGPIATRCMGYGKKSPIASGLIGAILVLAADMIGQYAFVVRFPVGVITGILGAPYLIISLIQLNKKGESV